MSPYRPTIRDRREGQVVLLSIVALTFVTTIVFASLTLVTDSLHETRHSGNRLNASLAARSGVERQIAHLASARDMSSAGAPWLLFDGLDTNPAAGAGGFTQIESVQPITDLSRAEVAEIDTFIDVEATGSDRRTITVTTHAYVPSRAAFTSGDRDAIRSDATAIVEIRLQPSEVFDYSYFINHWGWFFGNSIESNGNVRSNGIFDFGSYQSTVNGSPRYEGSNGTSLLGYLDDNGDGVTDGSDGGAYSGVGIVNAQNVRGMGGQAQNQHVTSDQVPMPNLSDLGYYEAQAIAKGGSIRVGTTTHVDGVLGDHSGELTNLYLVGTATNPIVLDGPVVVRGSVIISGYVTGQGSIYAGGNVYIPKDVQYVNAPTTSRPTSNDQATVEEWRRDAAGADSLGLFAKEHVVIGNYTHSTWQYYVSHWVNDANNESSEDAGIDGIQNTREGPDGVLGTADDDVLEGDGNWTVSYYTSADAAKALIPPGKQIGDVIPGSGEDIDGDGQQDGRTQMSEFDIPASLSPSNWAGNLTQSYSSYANVSTNNVKRIDAVMYTNHTLAALMINSGGYIDINGSIVSRNESIIYSALGIRMNHDERLTGRGTGHMDAPITWDPVKLLHQETGSELPAGVASSPDAIGAWLTGGGSGA